MFFIYLLLLSPLTSELSSYNPGVNLWIGLNDLTQEGRQWEDGSLVRWC